MKKILAFAFWSCAAFNALACEPEVYEVVSGDTLSAIAHAKYGRASLYPVLAISNGIENPDLILVGQNLSLPCATSNSPKTARKETRELKSWEPPTVVPDIQKEFVSEEDLEFANLPEQQLEGLPRNLTFALPSPPPSQVSLPAPSPEQPSELTAGEYKIILNRDQLPSLREGVFPGITISGNHSENNGVRIWNKREKMSVRITKVDGDDSSYTLAFVLPRNFTENFRNDSSIAFDLGTPEKTAITEIGSNLILKHATQVDDVERKVSDPEEKLKRKAYSALSSAYPIKQSKLKKVISGIVTYGPQTAFGFLAGGPIGAAVAGPGSFGINALQRKLQ